MDPLTMGALRRLTANVPDDAIVHVDLASFTIEPVWNPVTGRYSEELRGVQTEVAPGYVLLEL